MPVRRVEIPRIDCGDNGGCFSELISIIVYMIFSVVVAGAIIFTVAGVFSGLGKLLG